MKLKVEDIHQGTISFDTASIKLAVFDIDGTLADITHRRHFVASKPKNWKAFEKLIHIDLVKPVVRDYLWALQDAGSTIVLASGRNDHQREETESWLAKHQIEYTKLYMRKSGDYRADDIVKQEILDQINQAYGWPDVVFDDRNRVVDMWRKNNILTIQVAEGDF